MLRYLVNNETNVSVNYSTISYSQKKFHCHGGRRQKISRKESLEKLSKVRQKLPKRGRQKTLLKKAPTCVPNISPPSRPRRLTPFMAKNFSGKGTANRAKILRNFTKTWILTWPRPPWQRWSLRRLLLRRKSLTRLSCQRLLRAVGSLCLESHR